MNSILSLFLIFSAEFQNEYSQEIQQSLKIQKRIASSFKERTNIYEANYELCSSIIFPGLLSFSSIKKNIEDPIAKAFYAIHGSKVSDYSSGLFQMKPSFIEKLENSGFSATRHKIFFLAEISRPLFFLAMLLIGASFALRQARFGQTSILILLSVGSGFILFSIKRIAESLGAAEEIPLLLATFGPSISGILLATGLLLHFEDG